jgi:hypothetical protein
VREPAAASSRAQTAGVAASRYPINQLIRQALNGFDVSAVLGECGRGGLLALACHSCMVHDVRPRASYRKLFGVRLTMSCCLMLSLKCEHTTCKSLDVR